MNTQNTNLKDTEQAPCLTGPPTPGTYPAIIHPDISHRTIVLLSFADVVAGMVCDD